jgi:hypothetical protein
MNFIELGKAAHANGELRAPAANAQVMAAIAGFKVGNPETLRIMNDFTRGYEMGVQAECDAILAAA